eukprot:3380081-Pyramimonas_sp.AAC.1
MREGCGELTDNAAPLGDTRYKRTARNRNPQTLISQDVRSTHLSGSLDPLVDRVGHVLGPPLG